MPSDIKFCICQYNMIRIKKGNCKCMETYKWQYCHYRLFCQCCGFVKTSNEFQSIPVHVLWSSERANPSLQEHVKDPGVLVHWSEQPLVPSEHSSISIGEWMSFISFKFCYFAQRCSWDEFPIFGIDVNNMRFGEKLRMLSFTLQEWHLVSNINFLVILFVVW